MPNLVNPETPRMTAEDAEMAQAVIDESLPTDEAAIYARRVLATYHALAASQQDVERLQRREREALDAHASSFGALAAISRLTALGGEVDEYDDVTKAVESALALAQKDGERLALLAKWAATPLELDRMGGLEGDPPVGPFFLTFESPEVTQYSAPTLRDVIDKVEAAIQSTAIAPSPPPETTQGETR